MNLNCPEFREWLTLRGYSSANKVMIRLLVNQGLQVEELKAMKVQVLQLREGAITVHPARKSVI